MSLAAALRRSLADGCRIAAATLVDVEGSAPLPPGATMLVDTAGRIEGSITGGCVESALAQEAAALLARGGPPALLAYGVSDEFAGSVGLSCGGTVHVLLRELRTSDAELLARFYRAIEEQQPAGLATLVDGPRAGAAIALLDGERIGSLGGPPLLEAHVEEDLRGAVGRGRGALLRYGSDGSRQGAELRVHVHAKGSPPQLIVVGAIDFSAAIAPLAQQLGYRVTICDPRAAFLSSPRLAHAAEVVVGWPRELLHERRLGPRDAVLVFSHDPKIDEPALLAALASDVGYVGALGSRRTTVDRARRLRAAGATPAMLDRIFAPCGLDLGGATAEETALAVLAEIVAHQTGRSGKPLRQTHGPIHG